MRGLDTRVDYANAVIGRIVNPESDDMHDVLIDAYALGIAEFDEGEGEPPTMFADVWKLVAAWRDGYESAERLAAMQRCSGCHDGTGNPCRIHG